MMKVRVAATYVIRKFDSKVIVIVFDLYRDYIAFIYFLLKMHVDCYRN